MASLQEKDKKNVIHFTPLKEAKLPKKYVQTKMLVAQDGKKRLIKSDAYLYIFQQLGGRFKIYAFFGRLVPRPIRDATYGIVSANRHRL